MSFKNFSKMNSLCFNNYSNPGFFPYDFCFLSFSSLLPRVGYFRTLVLFGGIPSDEMFETYFERELAFVRF